MTLKLGMLLFICCDDWKASCQSKCAPLRTVAVLHSNQAPCTVTVLQKAPRVSSVSSPYFILICAMHFHFLLWVTTDETLGSVKCWLPRKMTLQLWLSSGVKMFHKTHETYCSAKKKKKISSLLIFLHQMRTKKELAKNSKRTEKKDELPWKQLSR